MVMILALLMDWRKASPCISTNTGCIRSTEVAADPLYRDKLRVYKPEILYSKYLASHRFNIDEPN